MNRLITSFCKKANTRILVVILMIVPFLGFSQDTKKGFVEHVEATFAHQSDSIATTLEDCKVTLITMMAQPLAWMEVSFLPEEAFKIAPVIKKYTEIQADIHKGEIFPIGNEPSGTSWTGFQSIHENKGYILVFREKNDTPEVQLDTWFKEGDKVRLKSLLGQGRDFEATAEKEGKLSFSLPDARSYALYEYKIL